MNCSSPPYKFPEIHKFQLLIELDDGKIYRKPLYLMVKTMVSCRFSLKPIHWTSENLLFLLQEDQLGAYAQGIQGIQVRQEIPSGV